VQNQHGGTLTNYHKRQLASILTVVGFSLFWLGVGALAPTFDEIQRGWFLAMVGGAAMFLGGNWGKENW
jgi:hypothetical protein